MKICNYCGKKIRRTDVSVEVVEDKEHYHHGCYFNIVRTKKIADFKKTKAFMDIEKYCKYCDYLENLCKESLPPDAECIPECETELKQIQERLNYHE